MKKDEIALHLMQTFIAELDEQLEVLNAEILAWESDTADPVHVRTTFRIIHTVKGAAQVAGVALVERAANALESLLAPIRDGTASVSPAHFRLLFLAADALGEAVEDIRAGADIADSKLDRLLPELHHGASRSAEAPTRPRQQRAARESTGPVAVEREARVRVDPDRLDSLLAAAAELRIAVARLTDQPHRLDDLRRQSAALGSQWRRSSRTLRLILERAGAPGALTSLVNAVDEHLPSLVRGLGELRRNAGPDVQELARLSEGVTETVRRVRLHPFGDACTALPRAARDVAAASGKEVELALSGQDIEVDRAVVDRLREPLLHLVRNAVDHGIEPLQERISLGKPHAGTVEVGATLAGDRFVVHVRDDGKGLNLSALRSTLRARGLAPPAEDRALVRALFSGGLSARSEPTVYSGRGVGLDVVRAAVEGIGGSADVDWRDGSGTTFTLEVPNSTATLLVVLVRVGRQLFAFPAVHVLRLLRITPDQIRSVDGRPVLAPDDNTDYASVPVAALADVLGPPITGTAPAGSAPALLIRAGKRRLVLTVDELLATAEVVVRPLDAQRTRSRFVSAGAVLPTGRIALVLLPVPIVYEAMATVPPEPSFVATSRKTSRPRVLVIDDSIATRTLERSVLEAAGYEVITAVDGDDGWRQLQSIGADLVIADVHMPGMDGFALAEAIRSSTSLRHTPIVMVTGMEGAEDLMRGMEIGADAYIAKREFNQESLVQTVKKLLGA